MTAIIELLGYQSTAAGVSSVEFPVDDSRTALDALNHIVSLYPETYLEPDRVMFNINGQRLPAETVLKAGDTVAFLPIIGGG